MRYIKVLILAVFFFLALVFFFQNQTVLSQKIPLTMDLFFLPPFTSIPLPFYFLVIGGFLVGCLLSLCWLLWDKVSTSAKLVKARWKLQSLQGELTRVNKELDKFKAIPALAPSEPKEEGKEENKEK